MRHTVRSISTLFASSLLCVGLAHATVDDTPAAPKPSASKPAAATPAASVASGADRAFVSADRREKAEAALAKAEAFLRSKQNSETGGWSMPKPGKDGKTPPQLPGISALVMTGLLMNPKADAGSDQVLMQGEKYLLNLVQPDGGVYDKMLPSYNTALAVTAFSKLPSPRAKDAMQRGVDFLRKLQWCETSSPDVGGSEAPKPIDKDHPFYGGVGYGRHGRPDNSNLNMFMQAMQDAGVSPEDEAVQRALVFLKRTQMDDRINDMPYAKGSRQGGFVYATVENAQSVDGRAGQSMAGSIEETLSDGTKASRLRAYGSMTYAGFKSYVYANLPKDDVRVTAAYDWIRRNYTVQENPGMGTDGLYYYYVVFSRALRAWGEPTIQQLTETGSAGESRRWGNDLVDKLLSMQNDDGSFKSVDDRWMENDPVLITAYSVIALRHCLK